MLQQRQTPQWSAGKPDLAYACFLPPAFISLVSAIFTFVEVDPGTAGGIGFLVLVPLSLLSLVSIPTGIFLTVLLHREIPLLVMSVATIAMIVEFLTEAGSVGFYNAVNLVYAIVVVSLNANWFLARRRRKTS